MKVKILLTPLLLVLSVAMIIWFVYPSFNTLLEKRQELKDMGDKVEDLDLKEQVIGDLMETLNENAEEQATVVKFLPDSRNEEDIIANLNGIAGREGLSVFNLSVMQPAREVAVVESDNPTGNGNDLELKVNQTRSKLKDFDVELSVYGGYDNVKNLITNVYRLERFNKISSLNITKGDPTRGDGNPANLLADFVFNFNYLPKTDLISNVDDKIFTDGKFNMEAVAKIKDFKDYDFYRLNAVPSGRANPFLP